MTRPRKRLVTVLLLLAIGVAFAGILVTSSQWTRRVGTTAEVRYIEPNFVTDVTDARQLVGLVDNVFIGRVVSEAGMLNRDPVMPETLFNVEVRHNIKGTLAGTVVVNQQGGFSEEEGGVILMEDDALLQVGKTYLFATKPGSDSSRTWHTLVPVHGDIPVKDAQAEAALIGKYTAALKQQIPFNPNKP
jgi:hypothetical protein